MGAFNLGCRGRQNAPGGFSVIGHRKSYSSPRQHLHQFGPKWRESITADSGAPFALREIVIFFHRFGELATRPKCCQLIQQADEVMGKAFVWKQALDAREAKY